MSKTYSVFTNVGYVGLSKKELDKFLRRHWGEVLKGQWGTINEMAKIKSSRIYKKIALEKKLEEKQLEKLL